MGVLESQFATWSNRGASTTAETTYTSIKAALAAYAPLKQYDVDVYLQGSYGNATNIHGNSDVDVVAELRSSYFADLSRLTEAERKYYASVRSDATYRFTDFWDDVQHALESYYGRTLVTPRNKCVFVAGASGRQNADVVPCLQHRLFNRYSPSSQDDFIPGIKFFARQDSREIVNFPKPHRSNGASKNQRTTENYKPSVRIFKNWRDSLIADRKLRDGITPSYFVECLMFNVPDSAFSGKTWTIIVENCLRHLSSSDLNRYICQNGVTPLFGNTPEQWNIEDARAFIIAAVTHWSGR